MSQKTLHQQTGKFIACIAENLPDLTIQEMQTLIQDPRELEKRLYQSLVPRSRQGSIPLILVSKRHPLIIDACDGSETFKDASDVFDDHNMADTFELFEKSKPTEAILAEVYGVNKRHSDSFRKIFSSLSVDLDTLCFTEHQIKRFCQKHKSWLSSEDGVTNFLFKKNSHYLIAYVYRGSLDQLNLNITDLDYDKDRAVPKKLCRIITPQLIF